MVSNTESTDHHRDGLLADFAGAVSSLADGDLTFKAPFDLASSTALADNIDDGGIAQRLFEVTALRDCGYEVRIMARSLDHPDVDPREMINTSVRSTRMLISLLEGLLDELYDHDNE